MKKIVLLFLLVPATVLLSTTLLSNEFVVKKKKRVTVGKIKQQCCDELTCLLKVSPDILKLVADIQGTCFESVQAFLEDENRGVFANKNKQQLQELVVQLKELNKIVNSLQHALQKQTKLLKA